MNNDATNGVVMDNEDVPFSDGPQAYIERVVAEPVVGASASDVIQDAWENGGTYYTEQGGWVVQHVISPIVRSPLGEDDSDG